MATLVVQQPAPFPQSRSPPPISSGLSIDTSKFTSVPIPNKHIPYCSPGPAPVSLNAPATPPASPPSKSLNLQPWSILYPPDHHKKIINTPSVYLIEPSTLAAAIDRLAAQPLPEPKLVFPWLHGLHQDNQVQLAFFIARRKALRKTPKCLRNITIVKAGGDLTKSRLKGAVSPREFLSSISSKDSTFVDVDPKDGFSVRNFHIQVAKMAMVSDIVIYGEDNAKEEDVYKLAKRISRAQKARLDLLEPSGCTTPFNTFVVSSPFSAIQKNYPELVAVDAEGQCTGRAMDFFQLERQEMSTMSKASEIAHNVWLGPTPEALLLSCSKSPKDESENPFDVYIEASDLAHPSEINSLRQIAELSLSAPQHLEFPSSGSIMPPTWSHAEADGLMETCRWIYKLANPELTPDPSEDGEQDGEDDIPMKLLSPRPRKFLIHCTDGYTESSLLGLAYLMFVDCLTVHEAWIRMHCEKKRNFFAYPSDVSLLSSIQLRIMQESPRNQSNMITTFPEEPPWLNRIDGSLPSRILPYMYLGNLGHANNPDLLKAMGIGRILSVGEPVSWPKGRMESWGMENLMFVDRVQDNGVDPLTDEFERCLEFIGNGKASGTATLVHCRVGVSRSATICIAEVMASLGLSFPRAYCFVRARRLNVIIQPHLRFAYELLKWEEVQQQKRGLPLRRELEWPTITREIAAMNKPYTR